MTDGDLPEQPPRGTLRIGWVILALMVAGLLVSGWFIANDRHPVTGRATMPPMLGGSGSVVPTPSFPEPPFPAPSGPVPVPSMPRPTAPPVQIPPPVDPGQDFQVAGVGKDVTIECTDHDVSVSGVDNTVTLTGRCNRVDVSGVGNTVVIDSAEAIDVSGMNNKVTFHSGAPQLDNSGIDNSVEHR